MVGAFLLREEIEEFSGGSPCGLDVARLCGSHQALEL